MNRKPRRPLAYIAGPYTAPDYKQVAANVLAARIVARKLFKLGFATHTPHSEMWGWEDDNEITYEDCMSADLEVLSRCDAIVLVPGWESSPGARTELQEARRLGLAELYSGEEAAEWIARWKEERAS